MQSSQNPFHRLGFIILHKILIDSPGQEFLLVIRLEKITTFIFENGWFESGEGLALYNWLNQNAASFCFCRPYTAKDGLRPYGYNEEKWHWSYSPLASKYLSYAKERLTNDAISGFLGSEQAATIDVVNKYVFGINSSCF